MAIGKRRVSTRQPGDAEAQAVGKRRQEDDDNVLTRVVALALVVKRLGKEEIIGY